MNICDLFFNVKLLVILESNASISAVNTQSREPIGNIDAGQNENIEEEDEDVMETDDISGNFWH